MRFAVPLAIIALAAALVGGCGSSGDGTAIPAEATAPAAGKPTTPAGASARECRGQAGKAFGLRATNLSCGQARRLTAAWLAEPGCAPADGASRSSCKLEGYECLTAVTDRGLSVGCARPDHSIAFTVRSG